jgi:hypothetical protein
MGNEVKNLQIVLPERVDTFNFETFLKEIREGLKSSSSELVLNMNDTRFLSLPFIKKLAGLAVESRQGQGKALVLLNASEKIKKQIGIFSDIEAFELKRAPSMRGWPELGGSADF